MKMSSSIITLAYGDPIGIHILDGDIDAVLASQSIRNARGRNRKEKQLPKNMNGSCR